MPGENVRHAKVSLEDKRVERVNAAITSAKEKLVNAGNGTLSDDDRLSLASDLQGIRDQLMNLANSADGNGRYIFAGYKTEAPPFDSVTGDYNGGTQAISQQVDTARNMVISHTGQQIFESITSNAKELLRAAVMARRICSKILDSAISALKVPVDNDSAAAEVQNKAISDAQIGITNTQNNVLTVVADGYQDERTGKTR